jgi:hypothetical protein
MVFLCSGRGSVFVDPHVSLQERAIFDGDAWCIDVADNGGIPILKQAKADYAKLQ